MGFGDQDSAARWWRDWSLPTKPSLASGPSFALTQDRRLGTRFPLAWRQTISTFIGFDLSGRAPRSAARHRRHPTAIGGNIEMATWVDRDARIQKGECSGGDLTQEGGASQERDDRTQNHGAQLSTQSRLSASWSGPGDRSGRRRPPPHGRRGEPARCAQRPPSRSRPSGLCPCRG